MDLLPRNCSDFSDESYWQSFFNRRSSAFEWYGNYGNLRPLLQKYIRSADRILHVGCGNSTLGYEIYRDLAKNVLNVDLSEAAIAQMTKKYSSDITKGDGLAFQRMDALNLPLEEGQIDVVLDKGTFDALLGDAQHITNDQGERLLSEAERVLKSFGRFVCISLLQEHVLRTLLAWIESKAKFNFLVRIQKINLDLTGSSDHATQSDSADAHKFPVFMIILTKLKERKPTDRCLYELSLTDDYQARFERTQEQRSIQESVKQLQSYSLIRHHLASNRLPANEEIVLELFDTNQSEQFKYRLHVLEQVSRENKHKLAVFLVPIGREREFLFGTKEGRLQLAKSCTAQRLIVVHLNGNYSDYPSIEQLKDELSDKVAQLCPSDAKTSKHPIFSVEEQQKVILHRGQSDFSGKFIVAEVPFDQTTSSSKYVLRQLIFESNRNVIQSEARIRTVKQKNKMRKFVDHSWLACAHHSAFFYGFCLFNLNCQVALNKGQSLKVLLIGLGGGCFASFVQHNYRTDSLSIELDAIEIDSQMVQVAQEWFSMNEVVSDSNVTLKCHVADGLDFVHNQVEAQVKYDLIIFDVDNKESQTGLSCPPRSFVEKEFIRTVRSLLSADHGLFMLNLAARNQRIKQEVLDLMNTEFDTVFKYDIPDETNTIAYCFQTGRTIVEAIERKSLNERIETFETSLNQCLRNESCKSEMLNYNKFIEQLILMDINGKQQ